MCFIVFHTQKITEKMGNNFIVIHPLLHAKKFILVGDPAQLPPVVQNPAARKLGKLEPPQLLFLVQNLDAR